VVVDVVLPDVAIVMEGVLVATVEDAADAVSLCISMSSSSELSAS
jgi:hypothetical protein